MQNIVNSFTNLWGTFVFSKPAPISRLQSRMESCALLGRNVGHRGKVRISSASSNGFWFTEIKFILKLRGLGLDLESPYVKFLAWL
jgi:hypothetical protein